MAGVHPRRRRRKHGKKKGVASILAHVASPTAPETLAKLRQRLASINQKKVANG